MQVLKAGAVYFLIMFGVGWILGPIRELWAVPRFGRLTDVLLEAVIMLIAMAVSSRWVIRRFQVKPTFGSTISMGIRRKAYNCRTLSLQLSGRLVRSARFRARAPPTVSLVGRWRTPR